MAAGRRRRERQAAMFVPSAELSRAPGHPFYERLNELLSAAGFDEFAESRCARFYAERMGRPSVPAGVYFRMLMIGYFEGIGSERGIAWRCADSRSLCDFLGYGPTERTPDHTTLSKMRQRLDVQAHDEIFGWVLALLAEKGLVKGERLGIDASTLEANAAMRSLVRKDDGRTYAAFLDDLAKSSGIETPTRDDRKKLDRKRPRKASNDDWTHPHDPDARITKMKDGTTHMAYKAEHAVDLDTGAIVAVTVQPADRGDTTSVYETLAEASDHLKEAAGATVVEVALDKGYHSDDVLLCCDALDIRAYASEPKRGRRNWTKRPAAQRLVTNNRRRVTRDYGKALLRKRGEFAERPFAHTLDSGGMRRAHVRGRDQVVKRTLAANFSCNLGLLMRSTFGAGTPKGLADRLARLARGLVEALGHFGARLIASALRLIAHATRVLDSRSDRRPLAA